MGRNLIEQIEELENLLYGTDRPTLISNIEMRDDFEIIGDYDNYYDAMERQLGDKSYVDLGSTKLDFDMMLKYKITEQQHLNNVFKYQQHRRFISRGEIK